MSDSYYDHSDRAHNADYKAHTPDVLDAWRAFDATVFATEGREIPVKYRQLMALAVALTTQCVYCIESHSQAAVKAGASQTELAETAWVATAIRAGGGFAHGRLAFKLAGEHSH
ncbi:MAG: carboxymuconolactone decarboxylase family protein [Microbacteriaceae bacterium]|nr:carboxymuconolactone decarboxylase family protein [Microbacteriaceae bacterium]